MSADMEHADGGRDPWVDRLSDYLDDEMKVAERGRLEAHLAECARCSAALAELRAVVARAHSLEDAPPAEELWPGIEAQMAPRARGFRARDQATVDGRAWWERRFDLALPQLAAAAVLLVALSAGAVWLALRGPALRGAPGSRPSGTLAIGATAPAPAARRPTAAGIEIGAAPALAMMGNPRYDAAVAELERALAEGRGKLDPRTLVVVEQNLRIIDRALDDARRAVAADPGNSWLRSHLAATMQRKVDLLRSASLLAAAQG